MTKDELKKEAEEYSNNWKINKSANLNFAELVELRTVIYKAYLAGAEPREKRIAELEKENAELKTKKIPQLERKIASIRGCHSVDAKKLKARIEQVERLKKENAELKSIAEFQQSSNMSRHFENKKLKEGLAVGSMWNKHLNSQNKALEEEIDRYRNMTFDQREQLTKAKEIIKDLLGSENTSCEEEMFFEIRQKAEQFLKDSEVEK